MRGYNYFITLKYHRLLRADQRSALCVIISSMIKIRQIKSNLKFELIIDNLFIYPQDPVEVERLRVKNGKINASSRIKLLYREGYYSILGVCGKSSLIYVNIDYFSKSANSSC